MQSKAANVTDYLASLPADRREAITEVRKTILANLDKDYVEGMSYGMIGYYVPHSVYPPGYHCDPKQGLPFAGLASQKNHMSVYLMCLYSNSDDLKRLEAAFKKAGKKLDMGKCCIRFKKLDDLPLPVIGDLIQRVPARKYIEYYESAINTRTGEKVVRKPAAKKKKVVVAKKQVAKGKR
ncbi:MAG: DUF1801 domain-containing protein [Gemmatales bacterium]